MSNPYYYPPGPLDGYYDDRPPHDRQQSSGDNNFLTLVAAAANQIPGSYRLSAGHPAPNHLVQQPSHPHQPSSTHHHHHQLPYQQNPYPQHQPHPPHLIVSNQPPSPPPPSGPSPTASGSNGSNPHLLSPPSKAISPPVEDGPKKRKASESVGKKAGGGGKQTTLSCCECRRLKLKCDRVFPCANCKKRGVATICPEGELKGGKGKRLILASTESLHQRIGELEAALRDLTKDTPAGSHPLLESSHHYEALDPEAGKAKGAKGKGGAGALKGKGRKEVTASQEGEGSSLRAAKGKGRDRDPTYGGETDGGGADGLDSGASTDIEQQKGDRRDVKVKIEGTGMGPETDGIDGNSLMMDVPRGNEGIEGVEANFGQLTMGDEPGQSRYFGSGSASAYLLTNPSSHSPSSSSNATNSPMDHPDSSPINSTNPLLSPSSLNNGSRSSSGANGDLHFGISPALHPNGMTDSFPLDGLLATGQGGVTIEMLKSHLPSRDEAWALADTYFRNGSWMYNILPRNCFDSRYFYHVYPHSSNIYNPLYPPRAQPSTQQLAVVYLVIALGALFDLNMPPHNDLANRYYALGRAALSCNCSGSVAFVVCSALMGTFLLNGTKAVAGGETFWPILGLAVRNAQAIGLHRDGANWGLLPAEVNERRRCFWEIYSYDVLQSTSQGRPRVMHERNFDAQLPGTGSEEDLKAEPIFHQNKYKLIKIIAKINDIQTQVTPVSYESVLAIDRELRAFERSLPAELHCSEESCVLPGDSGGVDGRTLVLQRHAMLIVLSQALLFLHRGWFARALRDHPDEPLRSKSSQSYVAELEACKTILSLIRDLMKLQGPLASRWWFWWFQAFSACVCLAAVCIRAPSSSLALSALQELELGVSLFEAAKVGSRARDELPMLIRLRDRAKERIKAHLPSPKTNAKPPLVKCTDEICEKEDMELMGGSGTKLVRLGNEPHCHVENDRDDIAMGQPSSHLPPSSFQLPPGQQQGRQPMHQPILLSQHQRQYSDQSHHPQNAQQSGYQQQPQANTSQHINPQQPHQQPSRYVNSPFYPNLPTTVDEAVAARPLFSPNASSDAFFTDPSFWSVNGGGTSSFSTNPLSPNAIGGANGAGGGGLFGFGPPDAQAGGITGMGRQRSGTVSRDGAEGGGEGEEPGWGFDFNEFIAQIGIPPTPDQAQQQQHQQNHPQQQNHQRYQGPSGQM